MGYSSNSRAYRTAARVALAVAPARYGALHRLLMRERRALTPDVIFALVARAGDDPARVRAVLARDGAAIDARLAATARAAAALGLPGTPAYLIGDRLVVGALDRAGFARAFASARRHTRLEQAAALDHQHDRERADADGEIA